MREKLIEELMGKFGYTRREAEALVNRTEEEIPLLARNPNPDNLFLLAVMGVAVIGLLMGIFMGKSRKERLIV